ncbi:MAG: protein jag [Clostridia bacterium]|nr:protein jag [Clostridia bacterium]
MANSIISEGKTTNEAIENGLKKLKVSKNMVDVKVIENEDKRSFFSILTPRVVKVELTVKEHATNNKKEPEEKITREKREYKVSENDIDKAKNNIDIFLPKFIENISSDAKYDVKKNNDSVEVNIDGENIGFLIGYRGETLYATQNILSAVANKGIENRVRIMLDIAGYKHKREKTLEDLAEKTANRVIRTRKNVTLEPMQAYERKIIHSKLQDNNKITTHSIGEEPHRRIVVSLNK